MSQTGGATSTANVTYTYDANGALLTDGLRHYAYDSEGRLAAASLGWSTTTGTGATTDDSITKYAHNSQAQRVFKTAPLYAVTNPEPTATPTVLAAFTAFFESLWSPATNPDGTTVQKAGMSYVYDEDGTLIADTLTGGATTAWGQSARYVYLPTASGPMPVAAIYGTKHYAIQSDHLNTPRRLIQSDGQVAWQWAYSAFGEEKPTTAKTRFANTDLNQSFGTTTVPAVTFNLRYPGQYFDQESNLHYNYHRSYSATTGRYTQSDPIGLDGGWNRFGYVGQNPLSFTDPLGLAVEMRCRPADIAAGLVNHCWIKTDTKEAGMNEQASCSRAGNDASGWPFQPVVVSDHSCDKPTIVIPLPNVNESCVNGELQLGKPLGRFAPPFNSCQTFTQDVIQKCSPNNMPYISYPGFKKRK
jgi:RHS repeat-associated protein